ncbi:hypothetical protein M1B72_19010 [Geomonas paludis]|uniref:Uncharacterized protein n=1 Tax=Geomonas paludis TaxID=2740185 RepID=A0A6V8MTH4_9BACT|nr:hypothetical protein [Geomonas paludis]UPU35506.1 hypothetical protein M1B72_19010 [Geomonas paludis]GFO62923.1 hypothetical protein GMPD_08420 [Geomonas paludis]
MHRDLQDFWHFSRPYRLFQRVASLSHDLLDLDHNLSPQARQALERLNRDRVASHLAIAALELPSYARCDRCQGACCREPADNYFTAIDYWLRRHTDSRVVGYAVRPPVPLAGYLTMRLGAAWHRLQPGRPGVPAAKPSGDRCVHLGPRGCLLPHVERPLKCLIYACDGLKRSLDEQARSRYVAAIKELQKISIGTFEVLKQEAGRPAHYGVASLFFTL